MKTDYDTVWDWTLQNESKPLWLQRPSEVEKEEYDGFFKTTFKEFMDPLAYNHFNVEGTYEFSGIVYIPGMAPFDMQEMQEPDPKTRKEYLKFLKDSRQDNRNLWDISSLKGDDDRM